ncbi:MAG TPA: ABC transporter ATP-binding protein [Xanthomonadales bacterium]|nr:ABC transporter ATP-binding protein [Xanthomonadales bacterium]
MSSLLEVRGLRVSFDTPDGQVTAVNGVDFGVGPGETLAIVGESGSGKSQLVLAMMGLLAENGSASGSAKFKGAELMGMTQRQLNSVRGKDIAMIFQDPMTSLNPFLTIERQMTEVAMHHQKMSHREARAHAVEMLRAVRIPDPEERIRQYPHEFSGGMRQRVMIAMGLLCEPDLLIADEPSTALDVTVQAQITRLLGELRVKSQMAIILITHDLAVVADICDHILVMYAGQVVESGSVDDIFYRPQHPYTRGLLASVPRLDRPADTELHAIRGNPPNLLALPEGCAFRDRCDYAQDQCRQTPPLWRDARNGAGERYSRCILGLPGGEIVNSESAVAAGPEAEPATMTEETTADAGSTL